MSTPEITQAGGSDIAIIAMHCRVPGANNTTEFWDNLKAGKESIVSFTDDELRAAGVDEATLSNPDYVKAGTKLDGIGYLDAQFFGFSPREAELMDPQQRLFMESAWEALEIAGYDASTYSGLIGVYGGVGANGYVYNLLSNDEISGSTAKISLRISNDQEYVTTHTSYKLNLRGPSLNVQTACSTSLVAVHLACQALLEGECDIALAGAASIPVPLLSGYLYSEGGLNAPDGHCRAFDHRAGGTTPGQGVGIVVLKRLEDALADGDRVCAVIKGSAVNNDGSQRVSFTAPGVDGQVRVIRAAQAVAGIVPADISYIEAHGTGTPIGDPIEVAALKEVFRAAGTRSRFCALGSVKTNIGHLGPAAGIMGLIKTVLAIENRKIPASLNFERPNPRMDLDTSPFYVNTQLRDWTAPGLLHAGVSSFGFGGTNAHVVVQEPPEPEPIDDSGAEQLIVLSAKTASALHRATRNLAEHLETHEDQSLADAAYTLQIGRKAFAHRCAFVCSGRDEAIRLLRDIKNAQVRTEVASESPSGVLFRFAGGPVPDIDPGRDLYKRNSAFRSAIARCAEWARPYIGHDLTEHFSGQSGSRAGSNGETEAASFAVEYAAAEVWKSLGIQPRAVTGYGAGEYVAACIAGVMSGREAIRMAIWAANTPPEEFRTGVRAAQLLPPRVPVLSSETGVPVPLSALTDSSYWADRRCRVSSASSALPALKTAEGMLFVEIDTDVNRLTGAAFLDQVGSLWLAGATIQWNGLYRGQRRRRVALTTYPFERQRYWIDPSPRTGSREQELRLDAANCFYVPCWRQSPLLAGPEGSATSSHWLLFVDDSSFSTELTRILAALGAHATLVRARHHFHLDDKGAYSIDAASPEDYNRLFIDLEKSRRSPARILHLWALNDGGVDGLPYLARALAMSSAGHATIAVAARGLWDVLGDEDLRPENSCVIALCHRISVEYARLRCRVIDIAMPTEARQRISLARQVVAEFDVDTTESAVAYRRGRRWVRRFERAPVHAPESLSEEGQSDGTCVILAGNRDSGLTVARALLGDVRNCYVAAPSCSGIADQIAEARQRGRILGIIDARPLPDEPSRELSCFDPTRFRTQLAAEIAFLESIGDSLACESLDLCVSVGPLDPIPSEPRDYISHAVDLIRASSAHRDNRLPWTRITWDSAAETTALASINGAELLTRNLRQFLRARVGAEVAVSGEDIESRRSKGWQPPSAPAANSKRRMHSRPALSTAYEPPSTEWERTITEVWQDLLGIRDIGVYDNFFEMGGNSLIATQLLSRLQRLVPVPISLQSVLTSGSVRTQSHVVMAAVSGMAGATIEAEFVRRVHPRPERIPLSQGQQRLCFLDRLQTASLEYNLPQAILLRGELDRQALEGTISALEARHEALRTRILDDDGELVQIVESELRVRLAVEDISKLEPQQQREHVEQAQREEWTRGFDLAKCPLWRVKLLRLGPQAHVLLRTFHHIIFDGWSQGVFNREFGQLYSAFRRGLDNPLPPLEVQYPDYALWQHRTANDERMRAEVEHWRHRLAGVPEELQLPRDRPRGAQRTFDADVCVTTLRPADAAGLRKVGQSSDATLYMTLLAAFAILMQRYSGQKEMAIGSPVANRRDSAVEGVIGYFVNTLVMRLKVDPDTPFFDLLSQVRGTALEAYIHQDVPFERLISEFATRRRMNTPPLYQVAFAAHITDFGEQQMEGLEVERLPKKGLKVRFDLEVHAVEREGRVDFHWLFNRDLFDGWRIQAMAGHYMQLLESVIANPENPIRDLRMMEESEERGLTAPFLRRISQDPPATLDRLFERQCLRAPNAIAVECDDSRLTYFELSRDADRVARCLLELGALPEEPIGICMGRSARLVTAIVGTTKAGCAYVPLDPAYPTERLTQVVEDAKVRIILTDRHSNIASISSGRTVIVLDELAALRFGEKPIDRPMLRPDNAAYVIYTSGSTGKPKGVVISHHNVVRLFERTARWFDFNDRDTWTLVHSYAFDFSVWEIWGALLYGGRLVVVPADVTRAPERFLELLIDSRVTVLNQTPSAFQHLIAADQERRTRGSKDLQLRVVIFGGEALDFRSLRDWLQHYGDQRPRLINMYGITETTVHVTYYPIQGADSGSGLSAIGVPIDDLSVYVLDEYLRPVPNGVLGDMYVSGSGLGRGYLNSPALTATRFVADPFSDVPGVRMYRTGDRARFRVDKTLEYAGRADNQVKVRGFRIELGDVEAAISEHPDIAFAAVALCASHLGENQLAAYVVPRAGANLDVMGLQQFLREKLPDYMIPAGFVRLDAVPLSPNGKIDRKALPPPVFLCAQTGRGPRTPDEELLCEIFANVLNRPWVTVGDDFFALGGHSLLATRLVSRIRAMFRVEVPLAAVFECPTAAALARRIADSRPARAALAREERPARLPLSYAQQRLWFLDQLGGGSAEYNITETLQLTGPLDIGALQRSIYAIVDRHETLRTRFLQIDGVPTQVIEPTVPLEIAVENLTGLTDVVRRQDVVARMRAESALPFDLSRAPLIRVRLLKLAAEEHVLLTTIHHIVSDGWSVGVFHRELIALYAAFREGRPNPLEPLRLQYADFTLWQRRLLEQGDGVAPHLDYWRARLEGIPDRLQLRNGRPRPEMQTFEAELCRTSLLPEDVALIRRFCAGTQATLYMVLLSAYAAILSRYSGDDDLVIGSPIANRQDADLEDLIGFFVNSLPIRVRLNADMTFRELVSQVRVTTLDAYQHQDLPFERLVEELSPQRSLNATPIFQIWMALHNAPSVRLTLGELTVEPVLDDQGKVRFDLELHAFEHNDGLVLSWYYNRDLFDRWRIEQMSQQFIKFLKAAVADPSRRLLEIDLIGSEGRHRLIHGWNQTWHEIPTATVPMLFESQAEATPGNIAVVAGGEKVTYQELNKRANRVAHWLVQQGVGPECVVALALPRSMEMVVGIWGILKSGAAYLPVEPEDPTERIAFVIQDARPSAVLTAAAIARRLDVQVPVLVFDSPEAAESLASAPAHNPTDAARTCALGPANAAYVIYTSGSTGAPKAALNTHGALVNRIAWMQAQYGLDQTDRVLQKTPFTFDVSVWEFVWPLIVGARLVMAPPGMHRDPQYLADAVAEHGITTMHFVPSMLGAFLTSLEPSSRPPLRRVIASGEALSSELQNRFFERLPEVQLHNLYGPTEAAIDVSFWACRPGDERTPPIGRPIWNTALYVLDSRLEPVPVGVPGELYIGGIPPARGYLRQPALTAERFVADPYQPSRRMYRTGDLARWSPEGVIEYLERVDQQIKIRGFRIEPGEIKVVLQRHPSVDAAEVMVQGKGDDERLIGYVVVRDEEHHETEAVQAHILDWQHLYDSTYADERKYPAAFNIAGWESSYTGEPIPADEMRIWVDETVARVRRLGARNILEIGCGSGLLLTRLASECDSYIGADFSSEILRQLGSYLKSRPELAHVSLHHAVAHDLSFAAQGSADLVILNSVIQYFPNVYYLADVLQQAARVVRPGGHVFVGDVRNLRLMDAFHASVELFRTRAPMTAEDLRQRVERARGKDEELALDPAFFTELIRRSEKLASAELLLKAGAYDNELSRFRYDVVIGVGEPRQSIPSAGFVKWDPDGKWRDGVRQALAANAGPVALAHTPDVRVGPCVAAMKWANSGGNGVRDTALLRNEFAVVIGENPDTVIQFAESVNVPVVWQGFGSDGLYDAIFRPEYTTSARETTHTRDPAWEKYANVPTRSAANARLARELLGFVRQRLPEYMTPSAIILLKAWPLNRNGKLNRKALPAPEFGTVGTYQAPRDAEEQNLSKLFGELLGLEHVGVRQDFFDIGGHSLLATRLVSQIRASLGLDISIRDIFEQRTVEDLALRMKSAGKITGPKLQPRRRLEVAAEGSR